MIAIIYEGERTEATIFKNINNLFFNSGKDFVLVKFGKESCVGAPFCGNIYNLYNKIKTLGEYVDVIELIRARLDDLDIENPLKAYSRDNFSEVYLFFDSDLQNKDECDLDIISEMLSLFNNETDLGKLYINYPMVESLKDCSNDVNCYYNGCIVNQDDFSNYKSIVNNRSKFKDVRKYNEDTWKLFFKCSCSKANCIVNNKCCKPRYSDYMINIQQKDIFNAQKKQFTAYGNIYILSSIPLFLLEYFGEKRWDEFL